MFAEQILRLVKRTLFLFAQGAKALAVDLVEDPVNISALGTMCKGYKVADVVIILGSIDIVLGELDR